MVCTPQMLQDGLPSYYQIDVIISSAQTTISTLGPANLPSDTFTLRIQDGHFRNVGFGAGA